MVDKVLQRLAIVLEVENGKLRRQLSRSERQLDRFKRRSNSVANSIRADFGGIFGGLVTAGAVRSFTRVVDEYNNLAARVQGLTREQGDFNQVFEELGDIANNVAAPLQSSVDLFSRLTLASSGLGASREEVLKVTQAFQQLGAIGGSSAEQIKNATLQFGQGLAEGVFRAEEFNSLISNTPNVVDRIAKGMGLFPDELTAAIRKGKVLSKDVFESLLSQTEQINRDFRNIPDSVERAGQRLSNSFQAGLAELDKTLGFTNAVAQTFSFWAELLDEARDSLALFNNTGADTEGIITRVGKGLGIAVGELVAGGNTPFEKRQEQLEKLRFELAELQRFAGSPIAMRFQGTNVQEVTQQIDDLQERIRILTRSASELRGQGQPLVIGITGGREGAPPPKFEPINPSFSGVGGSQQDRRVNSIQQVIDRLKEERDQLGFNEEQQVKYNLSKLGASQALIDQAANLQREITAFEDNADAAEEAAQAQEGYERSLAEFREEVLDSIDPMRELGRETDRVIELFKLGELTSEQFQAKLRLLGEEAKNVGRVTEETSNFARDFGLVTTSALEDAIVAGEDLRDVINGLGDDILRIVTRELVTKPIGNAVTDLVKGIDFGSIFGFSGSGGSASAGSSAGAGLGAFISKLFGAANGADFTIGNDFPRIPALGGDNRLVAFRARDGENVRVSTPGQAMDRPPVIINNNFPRVEFRQFERSQRQFNQAALAALGVN